MKKYVMIAAASLVVIAHPVSAQQTGGEIGYEQGSLGYDALVAGNTRTAILQIEAANLDFDDPARLINLGQAHARLGETGKAMKYLTAAQDAENIDLVLADGTVMPSRKAAQVALNQLTQRLASR